MSLATSLGKVAKNLTKSLGTTGVLKDKTTGVWNPSTGSFVETITDVPLQIAPWTNTSSANTEVIAIGDVKAVIWLDSSLYTATIDKGEEVTMGDDVYKVVEMAKYIPQNTTIAFYCVLRLVES